MTRTTLKIKNEETNEIKWYKVHHDSYPYYKGEYQMIPHYQLVIKNYLSNGEIEFSTDCRFDEIDENLEDMLVINSYFVEINLNQKNPNFKIFWGFHRYNNGDEYTYDLLVHLKSEEYRKGDGSFIYHQSDVIHSKEFDEHWLIETHTYDIEDTYWEYERDIKKILRWEKEDYGEIVGWGTKIIEGFYRNVDGELVRKENPFSITRVPSV